MVQYSATMSAMSSSLSTIHLLYADRSKVSLLILAETWLNFRGMPSIFP